MNERLSAATATANILMSPLAPHQAQRDGRLPTSTVSTHSDRYLVRVVHATVERPFAARPVVGLQQRLTKSLGRPPLAIISYWWPVKECVPQDTGRRNHLSHPKVAQTWFAVVQQCLYRSNRYASNTCRKNNNIGIQRYITKIELLKRLTNGKKKHPYHSPNDV